MSKFEKNYSLYMVLASMFLIGAATTVSRFVEPDAMFTVAFVGIALGLAAWFAVDTFYCYRANTKLKKAQG